MQSVRVRRSFAVLVAALLATVLLPVGAAELDYRIDPVHSRVLFSVRHLGYSDALGTFSAPRGWLRFDRNDWSTARAEAEIDLATLDLGDAGWNRRMARRDGFDSANHPLARFVSERVEPLDADRFRLHGQLSLRGTTAPISVDVQVNRIARNPLTLRRSAGFSATTQLRRSDFGLQAWTSMVADRVDLRIEIEAQRKRRRDAAGTGAPDSGAEEQEPSS